MSESSLCESGPKCSLITVETSITDHQGFFWHWLGIIKQEFLLQFHLQDQLKGSINFNVNDFLPSLKHVIIWMFSRPRDELNICIYAHYHNSNLIWRTVSRRVDEAIPSDHPRRVASRVIQWYGLIHKTWYCTPDQVTILIICLLYAFFWHFFWFLKPVLVFIPEKLRESLP